ncbi:MAG: EamA family transporter [Candidatus Dormibacteraeota bacterium]|nr:EamA family transporter [Candidatus Dormibacteraeota bacterium]
MTLAVILLALGAALLHATWNVLLKSSADPLPVTTRALAASAVIVGPLTLGGWLAMGMPGIPATVWGLLAASAVAETVYFVFLSRAYRLGDLSAVYPIARGTGPLVAVAGGLIVLQEKLSPGELLGVLALLLGVWAVRRPRLDPALAPALVTGVFIGIYTTLDRVGVRLAPPWLYGGILWVLMALLLIGWTRGRPLLQARPSEWGSSSLIGVLMAAAYAFTLLALAVAPVAVVAPLRESAVVLVTAWGIWRLRERADAARRLAGAGAIIGGAAMIAISGRPG